MPLSCLRQGIIYYLSFFSKLQGVFNKRLLDMATVGHDALYSNYTIALTHVLLFVLYLAGCLFVVIDTAHASPLIQIAGGLCASVFGFAAQPVKRTRKN